MLETIPDGHHPRGVQHLHDDDAPRQRATDVEVLPQSQAEEVPGGLQHLQAGLHQSHLPGYRRIEGEVKAMILSQIVEKIEAIQS